MLCVLLLDGFGYAVDGCHCLRLAGGFETKGKDIGITLGFYLHPAQSTCRVATGRDGKRLPFGILFHDLPSCSHRWRALDQLNLVVDTGFACSSRRKKHHIAGAAFAFQ